MISLTWRETLPPGSFFLDLLLGKTVQASSLKLSNDGCLGVKPRNFPAADFATRKDSTSFVPEA